MTETGNSSSRALILNHQGHPRHLAASRFFHHYLNGVTRMRMRNAQPDRLAMCLAGYGMSLLLVSPKWVSNRLRSVVCLELILLSSFLAAVVRKRVLKKPRIMLVLRLILLSGSRIIDIRKRDSYNCWRGTRRKYNQRTSLSLIS